MDYVGPADLEWQPNPTLVIAASIRVEVAAASDGWRVRAVSQSRKDHWALLAFDNPFVLRFPDGSQFDVGIGRPRSDSYFDVWDWSKAADHSPICPECGGSITETTVQDNSGPDLSGSVTITDRCDDCGEQHRTTYRLQGAED